MNQVTLGQGSGLVEVLYTAAGFLYTRRRVYEDIQRILQLPVCNREKGKT